MLEPSYGDPAKSEEWERLSIEKLKDGSWFKVEDYEREYVFVFAGQGSNPVGGLRAKLVFELKDILIVARPGGQVIRIRKASIDRIDEYEPRPMR